MVIEHLAVGIETASPRTGRAVRDAMLAAAGKMSLAALCVPLMVPLLTRRVWTFDDLAAFHLPMRFLYQQALAAGDSILWTPAFYSGVYIFGEGQAGAAHPLHVLLYRLLPLDLAFNLEILSSCVAAAAG